MPPQLHVELGSLVFARVTSLRYGRKELGGVTPPRDFDATAPIAHFYGFADDVRDGRSIWFKKLTHAGTSGVIVGPVALHADAVDRWENLPRRGTMVVGQTADSSKGPLFRWRTHRVKPLWAFARVATMGKVPPSTYPSLQLPSADRPDAMWALARLLVAHDVALLVDQIRPRGKRGRHPHLKNGHSYRRGLQLGIEPLDFVWHTAEFVRTPELFTRFVDMAKKKNLWTPQLQQACDDQGYHEEALARLK